MTDGHTDNRILGLGCSTFRGMIERDRDIEERRRDEMAEKLSVYKREVMSTNSQSSINHDEFSIISQSSIMISKLWLRSSQSARER